VAWNGVDGVETTLGSGEVVTSAKLLCAQGRAANVSGLDMENAGLAVNDRGLIDVNEFLQTSQPHIYAVGDVIGPPALASTSMEQGRRAMRHALGLPLGESASTIPVGIFTIPEMACIGLTEEQVVAEMGAALVGRADFSELARGQISCCTDGILKMVSDPDGRSLLGVQILGEGATELIHVGQMGMMTKTPIDFFVENIFNFPTLAEGYRVAALDIIKQRPAAVVV
jgi:NAD(P) transhydrogenase